MVDKEPDPKKVKYIWDEVEKTRKDRGVVPKPPGGIESACFSAPGEGAHSFLTQLVLTTKGMGDWGSLEYADVVDWLYNYLKTDETDE
jgi:hypothetical protein